MTVEGELGFLGGATFYQGETKVHLMVRRYFANDERGLVNRWWGTYVDAPKNHSRAATPTPVSATVPRLRSTSKLMMQRQDVSLPAVRFLARQNAP